MKAALIFHGVPRGYDVWGGNPDKYFDSFYGSLEIYKDAEPLMVLEIRKNENRFFSYYTFVKYKNLNAVDNRPGSYFGMTLKVDGQYCTDVTTLYDLFLKIYDKYIINTIIKKDGETGTYLVQSFESVASHLKEINRIFFEQIKSNFHDDFEPLSQGISKTNGGRHLYYNVDDIDCLSFFKASMNFGKILISAKYPTKDEILEDLHKKFQKGQSVIKEYGTSVEQLKEQNQLIPKLQEKLQIFQSEINKKEISLRSEREKNTLLEQNVKELEHKLAFCTSFTEIKELISKIDKPICELADILRNKFPDSNLSSERVSLKKDRRKSGKLNLKLTGLAAVVLFLLIAFELKSCSNRQNVAGQVENLELSISDLEAKNEHLKTIIEDLKQDKKDFAEAISNLYSNVQINLKDSKARKIKSGQSLTLSVKNGPEKEGEWQTEGFEIVNKDNTTITLIASERGKAFVSYCVCGIKVDSCIFNIE